MHFYLKLANNNHIGIFDILPTETMLVTTENPGPLPLLSQIRQIHAESEPGRIWDQDTGLPLIAQRHLAGRWQITPVFGVVYSTPL